MKKKKLSIIIPVFNNSDTLYQLYYALIKILKKIHTIDYKIIFVDDGSTDDSINILRKLSKINKKICLVILSKNFGQPAAVEAGIKQLNCDYACIIDADLQDPPKIILDMYKYIQKFDIIIAARNNFAGSIIRKIFSYLTYLIVRQSNPEVPKYGFNSIMFKKNVIIKLKEFTKGYINLEIYKIGFKKKIIYYTRKERKTSKSQYNISKLIETFLNYCHAAMYKFFKKILFFSLIIFILSTLNIIFIIYQHFFFDLPMIKGVRTLASYILFFGSFNLFLISLIGTNISKLIENSQKSKNYYVEEIINKS